MGVAELDRDCSDLAAAAYLSIQLPANAFTLFASSKMVSSQRLKTTVTVHVYCWMVHYTDVTSKFVFLTVWI